MNYIKSICFICHEYPPLINGGIGTFTKDLAESLVIKGFKITVIGLYDVGSYDVSSINGVEIHRIPLSKNKISFITNRLKFKKGLEDLIKNKKIDIIESPDFGGWLAYIKSENVKKIIRIHGSVKYFSHEMKENNIKNFLWGIFEQKSFSNADYILSVSDYTRKKTKKLFSLDKETKVLYNSVNFCSGNENKYIVSEKCKKFIFVGTLVEKKGIINLLKAWNMFISEYHINDAKLTIIGKDPSKILPEIKNKYFGSSIEYLGTVTKDELIKLYQQHDCAVFPSFSEAFALAPMEAMSIGIPVIYSSLSSGPELIESEVNGFLINPLNINEIKNCLNKLYQSNKLSRENISNNAFSIIKNKFSYNDFVDDNINEYLNA